MRCLVTICFTLLASPEGGSPPQEVQLENGTDSQHDKVRCKAVLAYVHLGCCCAVAISSHLPGPSAGILAAAQEASLLNFHSHATSAVLRCTMHAAICGGIKATCMAGATVCAVCFVPAGLTRCSIQAPA
jgi:hypothetical protein